MMNVVGPLLVLFTNKPLYKPKFVDSNKMQFQPFALPSNPPLLSLIIPVNLFYGKNTISLLS